MTSETDIQNEIRLAIGRMPDVRLFRNTQGNAWHGQPIGRVTTGEITLRNPRRITYGLAHPGGSDLIGLRRIRITPRMVGRIIAQFGAIEVKPPGRIKFEDGQPEFLQFVRDFGGFSGVAQSPGDALIIVEEEIR